MKILHGGERLSYPEPNFKCGGQALRNFPSHENKLLWCQKCGIVLFQILLGFID